jgi:hypothetical protein
VGAGTQLAGNGDVIGISIVLAPKRLQPTLAARINVIDNPRFADLTLGAFPFALSDRH